MHWLLVILGYLMILRISTSAMSWITLFEQLFVLMINLKMI
jgi:hypothetical protein